MSTLRRLLEALSDKHQRTPEDTAAASAVFCASVMAASSFFVPGPADDMIAVAAGAIVMLTVIGWVAATAWRHRRR